MTAVYGISWDDRKSRGVSLSISWDDRKRRVAASMVGAMFALAGAGAVSSAVNAIPHLASVVVRAQPGQGSAADQIVASVGGQLVSHIGLIDGIVANVPTSAIPVLQAAPSIAEVTADAHVRLLSSSYSPASDVDSLYNVEVMDGARAYWKAGYTGQGVGVALIDSGVTPVAGLSTQGKVINGPDLSFESQNTSLQHLDTFGHGTHMAGIIAGRDSGVSTISPSDSSHFLGVAPSARIVSLKVADSQGRTDVSQMLAAIDWVVRHRNDNGMNIRVLNLSFGTDRSQSYQFDPLAYAAEQAWKQGIVVVVSAGNAGHQSDGLDDPAIDPYVLAVAAADTMNTTKVRSHVPASFTSEGDGTRNPDLSAPGVHIASLRVPGSFIDQQFGGVAALGSRFFRGSGTSQAAAVVSGAAALLLSQRPSLTPDQVKALLDGNTASFHGNSNLEGSGELNLASVLHAATPITSQHWAPSTGGGVPHGGSGATPSWSGGSWSGGSWSAYRWAGASWSGASWSGASWSGASWSGASWSGASWSGSGWSGASWSSSSWSADTWS
jgi:serine protease AprX